MVGPVPTIAMLLPLTFNLPPVGALIMLAGIYYGAQYGGSTTSILVNLPGEFWSVVTCLDGYRMAKQGRAGPALAIAAIGSFFAGTVGTFLIALFGPPLAEIALDFGAPEYFSLMVLGLLMAVILAHGSVLKAIAMIVLGLLLRRKREEVLVAEWAPLGVDRCRRRSPKQRACRVELRSCVAAMRSTVPARARERTPCTFPISSDFQRLTMRRRANGCRSRVFATVCRAWVLRSGDSSRSGRRTNDPGSRASTRASRRSPRARCSGAHIALVAVVLCRRAGSSNGKSVTG